MSRTLMLVVTAILGIAACSSPTDPAPSVGRLPVSTAGPTGEAPKQTSSCGATTIRPAPICVPLN
jgi:uncharacterized lipoprotein YmbA